PTAYPPSLSLPPIYHNPSLIRQTGPDRPHRPTGGPFAQVVHSRQHLRQVRDGLEQALTARPVGHVGGMDQRLDDQAGGVHQEVALAPLHLLVAVKALAPAGPLFRSLDALAIDDGGATRRGPPCP